MTLTIYTDMLNLKYVQKDIVLCEFCMEFPASGYVWRNVARWKILIFILLT
jgi:hypothetical protein